MVKIIYLFLALSFSLFADNIEVIVSSYHVDHSGQWTVEDAYKNKNTFSPINNKNASLGFSGGAVWIYVKVHNKTKLDSSNMIEFPYPLHDYITMYEYINGKFKERTPTGDLTDFDTREVLTNDFVFPYLLKANETKELFFKINSHSSLNIGMHFHSIDKYYSGASTNGVLLGLYYGAIIIMLIYNFMLFRIIKEQVYLDYVTFHLTYFFLHLGLNGLAFEYLYPNLPMLNLYFIPILFPLANYYSIKFSMSFLGLAKYEYKIAWYLKSLMYSFLVLTVLGLFVPYAFIIKVNTVLSMFSAFSLLFIGIYVYKKVKTTSSQVYVIAWSFLLVGAIVGELQNLGFITMNMLTYYGAQLGAFIELSLLSLALAYRYNLIFLRLTEREQDLKVFNKDLERTIRERTTDLDTRNQELSLQVNNKNVLFRELYHRVKNNLQIITSLLTLQIRRVDDVTSKEILNETTQRIRAMSLIHEKLYQSNDLSAVSMQDYTDDLLNDLKQEFRRKNLRFVVECESIDLELEVAVPMGLIINELVTNAIKYAFNPEDKDQVITVKMYTTEHYAFILEIYDNGKGVDINSIQNGFGFKLVQSLAKYQLKGIFESYNDGGLHHKITFEKGLLV